MIVIKHRTSPDVILLRVESDTLDGFDLSEAYLPGAVLAGTRCRGTLFRDATLKKADLRGIDLQGADLFGANLARADLTGANLAEALLEGADFTGACLREADVRGADFSGARLSLADLTDVLCDARTQWPIDLEDAPQPAPAAGAPGPTSALPARPAAAGWWSCRVVSRISLAAAAAATAFLVFVAFTDLTTDRHYQGAPPKAAAIPSRVAPARSVRKSPKRLVSHSPRPVLRPQRIARAEPRPRAARRSWNSRTAGVRLVSQAAHAPKPTRSRPRVILVAHTAAAPRRQPVAEPVNKVAVERPEPPRLPFEPITPRGPKLAWGNRDFHYGSGYDIYRMRVPGTD